MDILPLVFTCKAGEVQFATVDTEKGGCPDWLFLRDDGKHVMFTGNAQKYSGKLFPSSFFA